MLYTFSKSNYAEIDDILSSLTAQDAVLLWQDGVNLLLTKTMLWNKLPATLFALDLDLNARGIHHLPAMQEFPNLQVINLSQLVEITENYTPQLAL